MAKKMEYMDNKEKRQFHRAVDSLNATLRAMREFYPDAQYIFSNDDCEIKMVVEPDRPRDKKQKNIAVRSFLDGDE